MRRRALGVRDARQPRSEALAEMFAASPYTTSRILAEWRRRDILDAQRARIIIHDRERPAAAAGERADRTGPKTAASRMS